MKAAEKNLAGSGQQDTPTIIDDICLPFYLLFIACDDCNLRF